LPLAVIFWFKLAIWGVVTVTVREGLPVGGVLPFSSAAQAPLQTHPNKQTIHAIFFMIDSQTKDVCEFIELYVFQRYRSPMFSRGHQSMYWALFAAGPSSDTLIKVVHTHFTHSLTLLAPHIHGCNVIFLLRFYHLYDRKNPYIAHLLNIKW
jgi:hypothetical protein